MGFVKAPFSAFLIILITLTEKPNFNQKFEFSRSLIWANGAFDGAFDGDHGHDGGDGRGGGPKSAVFRLLWPLPAPGPVNKNELLYQY